MKEPRDLSPIFSSSRVTDWELDGEWEGCAICGAVKYKLPWSMPVLGDYGLPTQMLGRPPIRWIKNKTQGNQITPIVKSVEMMMVKY